MAKKKNKTAKTKGVWLPDEPIPIDELIKNDLQWNIQRKYGDLEYLVAIPEDGKPNAAHNQALGSQMLQLLNFAKKSMWASSNAYKHPSVPIDLILVG
jgi:hypothetical protein